MFVESLAEFSKRNEQKEENKKIQKLDYIKTPDGYSRVPDNTTIMNKINEIIDYINKGDE